MAELIITKGLPGSGKSLWAKKWVARDPENRLRLHRGEFRSMLGFKFHQGADQQRLEDVVTAGMEAAVTAALHSGISVVIDGMNLRGKARNRWRIVCQRAGGEYWVEDFMSTPIEEILDHNRSAPKERQLPEARLRAMYAANRPEEDEE